MCWSREDYNQPSQYLVENRDLLPQGKALDIAMGTGRNALYLASLGCEVDGIDISPEAVQKALDTAQALGLHINAIVADMEKGDYRFEHGVYDLIVCFNYLHRPLIPAIKDGLKKGGVIVYETYLLEQAQYGKPKNPAFLLAHNELLDMFRDFRCLRYREGIIEGRGAVAGIVAEKV
jgi:tellurite methyltransferase